MRIQKNVYHILKYHHYIFPLEFSTLKHYKMWLNSFTFYFVSIILYAIEIFNIVIFIMKILSCG